MIEKALQSYKIINNNYIIKKTKCPIKCYNYGNRKYPSLNEYSRSLKNIKSTKLYEAIDLFEHHYSNYEKYIFSNLKNVKIKRTFFANYCGSVIHEKNNLKLKYRDNTVDTLYHELLHLSSSYINNNTWYCGLSQTNLKTFRVVGEGICEGYTQLLTNRDYNHEHYIYYDFFDKPKRISYEYNVGLAKLLEVGLGKEFMKNCYFAGDLYTLKEKIVTLVGEDDTNELFRNLDWFLEEYYDDRSYVEETLEKTQRILIRICIANGGSFALFDQNKFIRSEFHEDKYIPKPLYEEYVEQGLLKGEMHNAK